MKYTEALKKLFEVMEGRPEITEVKFNRKDDSFDVISGNNIHVCFGDEFRNKMKSNNKITNKYNTGDRVKTKIHFMNDPRTTVEATIIGIELIICTNEIRYKINFGDDLNDCNNTGYVYEDDIIELLS